MVELVQSLPVLVLGVHMIGVWAQVYLLGLFLDVIARYDLILV